MPDRRVTASSEADVRPTTVGLLPLTIELYDRVMPEVRPRMDAFADAIADELRSRGLEVVRGNTCRLRSEAEDAVTAFERASVDCIVTLHLAYHPSMESAGALAASRLPLIMLNTTPSAEFTPTTTPSDLMHNHGIHGVQDLHCVLVRMGRSHAIETGHWQESDVLDRVASRARSTRAAASLGRQRVGLIGLPFAGMGDFAIDFDVLEQETGIQVVTARPERMRSLTPAPDEAEVREEVLLDREAYDCATVDPDAHTASVRAGLAVRRWLAEERLTAFTCNFQHAGPATGLPTVPFLEACKAMARGIGYAGEGDVLTAALVGALAAQHQGVSFTEMFCPDWRGGAIFLSHMGEINPRLLAGQPKLVAKPFPWGDAPPPALVAGCLRPGTGIIVNAAIRGRSGAGRISLVHTPVTMLPEPTDTRFADSPRGWCRPSMPIEDVLGRLGFSHHLALVYGGTSDDMRLTAEALGWPNEECPLVEP